LPINFIPVSIPAGLLIDKKGFKFGVSVGAMLMALFAVLRILSGENFTLLLLSMAFLSSRLSTFYPLYGCS